MLENSPGLKWNFLRNGVFLEGPAGRWRIEGNQVRKVLEVLVGICLERIRPSTGIEKAVGVGVCVMEFFPKNKDGTE